MSLFQQTVTAAVEDRLHRDLGLPRGSLRLTELNRRGGYHVFGFSIFHLHEGGLTANLIVLAWDFVGNPSFERTFADLSNDLRPDTQIEVEGETHAVLDSRREADLGYLLCVAESESERFVRLMRALRAGSARPVPEFFHWKPAFWYDPDTNKVIGACTLDSALREYYAAAALHDAWPLAFSSPCPAPLPFGLISYLDQVPFEKPDGTREFVATELAFTHPDLRHVPPEWRRLGGTVMLVQEGAHERLAEWSATPTSRPEAEEGVAAFCRNVFGMIHVAHRFLRGSFTCAFGSALTASNVTPRGEVQDLETFRSAEARNLGEGTVFGDVVRDEDQIEDLVLGLELIPIYCSRVGLDPATSGAHRVAWATYAGSDTCPSAAATDARALGRDLFRQAAWRAHE